MKKSLILLILLSNLSLFSQIPQPLTKLSAETLVQTRLASWLNNMLSINRLENLKRELNIPEKTIIDVLKAIKKLNPYSISGYITESYLGQIDRNISFENWSSDGKMAGIPVNQDVNIWRDQQPFQIKGKSIKVGIFPTEHEANIGTISWSPKIPNLFATFAPSSIRIMYLENSMVHYKTTLTFAPVENFFALAWSPDGKNLISGLGNRAVIWDLQKEKPKHNLDGHPESIAIIKWSPDGSKIMTKSASISIIWDADTGVRLSDTRFAYGWSPDGTYIITEDGHRGANICNPDNMNVIRNLPGRRKLFSKSLQGHFNTVNMAEYSPDGKKIATSSFDNTVRIWDAHTSKILSKIEVHSEGILSILATISWSPDSSQILLSPGKNRKANIYNAQTGQDLLHLNHFDRKENTMIRAFWSPDGTNILTEERNGVTEVWNEIDLYVGSVDIKSDLFRALFLILVKNKTITKSNIKSKKYQHLMEIYHSLSDQAKKYLLRYFDIEIKKDKGKDKESIDGEAGPA
ncbi:hypothetical protein KAW80_04240 [Candidatus Babeliales bacterium]|nr:hypothetical protein [Candidatus Babeliales bacterium]